MEDNGSVVSNTLGQSWPALLAQAQANRDPAQASRDLAQAHREIAAAFREQALANHEAASALLLAMRSQCDPSACALRADELHCWYDDAKEVVNVAQRSVDVAEPGASRHHLPLPEAVAAPSMLLVAMRSTPLPSAAHLCVKLRLLSRWGQLTRVSNLILLADC